MDTDKLYTQAYAERAKDLHTDTAAMRAACEAGLCDGDRIGLGGKLLAVVHGDRVTMIHDGQQTADLAISQLTEQQRDRMIIRKAVQVGTRGIEIGAL